LTTVRTGRSYWSVSNQGFRVFFGVMSSIRRSQRPINPLLVAAVVLIAAISIYQSQTVSRMGDELRVAREEARAAHEQRDSTVSELETQIQELTETLSLSTEKLQQATEALATRRAAAVETQPAPPSPAEMRALQAAVKQPAVEVKTDTAGGETRIYTFPELIDPAGKVVATDMEFSRLYGTKLAFRNSSGAPVSYEAEELHAGILAHLGIDLYDAQRKQREWEEQIARRKELATQRQIAKAKAEQEARKEMAKLMEERRKERIEHQMRLAEIENERTKALAAMKQADAAMIEAQKPPTQLVNPFVPNVFPATTLVPTRPGVNAPMAPSANQLTAPQGAPQSAPFVAPTGQLPRTGQLKIGN